MSEADVTARFRTLQPGMELSLTRRFRQPMEKVFAALATPERIADWMGVNWQGGAGPLKLGDSFSYTFANSDMPSEGHVTAYDPPRLIEHTWSENEPPMSLVRWELEPEGDGCRLVLIHSFHQPPPRSALISTAASWHLMLDRLPGAVSGQAAEWSRDEWQALHDWYAEKFRKS